MDKLLTILGIGYKQLSQKGQEALEASEVVLGSRRLLEVFALYPEYEKTKDKLKRIDSVDETMRFIREAFASGMRQIVLLGSGDPFFFGIGRRAVLEFGQEAVEVLPDLSSLQSAFSRVKEPWDDALFVSLHAGPDPLKRRKLRYDLKDLPALLESHDTLGILTDKEINPAVIAGLLASSSSGSAGSIIVYVGEKMGYPDERITTGSPEEISSMSFEQPNVVIVKKRQTSAPHELNRSEPRFGLKESEITHSRGLITKDEVRAVTLHALRLPAHGVLWDVGAGSGSLSIEAARLSPGLEVFAIEKNPEQLGHMGENRSAFGTMNLRVVSGTAPEILASLPEPDRVFVGGAGGNLEVILDTVGLRMKKGIAIVNAATLETLNRAVLELEKAGFLVDVTQVSITRSRPVSGKRLMSALNPIFVIKGEKG
jgi:precorrin-6Y C5,15-methyltransferase (decarboxylating)